MIDCDIAVIGAGPAGLAFARGLAGSGLSVTLVERSPEAALAEPAFDGREIALTHRSVRTLQALGAWDRIPAAETAPLREALVLDGNAPVVLTFTPETRGAPLGTLVPNHLIRRALWESVQAAGCAQVLSGVAVATVTAGEDGAGLTLADGRTVTARLVVAADTRFSEARRQLGIAATMQDFGRSMLVARVAHEKPHGGIATEWFGHGQTIAMLPLNGDVSSLVLTLPSARIEALMKADEAAFNAEVTQRTERRWGALRLVGSRHAYPLVATYADRFVAPRFALVGDAAVGMHPVTAHGFNFGLSGAQRLGMEIRAGLARGRDAADPGGLRRYEVAHRAATWPLFTATNAIASLYTDDSVPARLLRGAVMRLGSALAPARRLVTAQLMQATTP
ncbi:5-demethoxyubiquinol-8 5-hydroxylase UbiM [Rhodocista pekingensis]|uniref:5-demethoxyubiquinol-8 5-hydroxylase UbiM n=1 Tax=Rhodocista pekingensis TaxID=201185 RepID=A0ABW2KYY1_9PROT